MFFFARETILLLDNMVQGNIREKLHLAQLQPRLISIKSINMASYP